MKFQPDTLPGVNLISHHGPEGLRVNGVAWARSVVVPSRGDVTAWAPADFGSLQPAHFDQLLGNQPEVVIFGSGARLRFPAPALLRGLIDARIGVETMDNAAACRTYNVLASEGRLVVAALLIETADRNRRPLTLDLQ
jgi:uncharacterized protein